MTQHAVLSPSSAERWLLCPASVKMAGRVGPGTTSIYAEEGTCAHQRSEIEVRLDQSMVTLAKYAREMNNWRKKWQRTIGLTEGQEEEMAVHATAYAALIRERMQRHPNSVLMLEQRVPTGVPSCWGTSDAVIVSPVHVEIIDLKYGMGIRVSAPKNPQLRLYAVGALEAFGDILGYSEETYITVFQPRLNHVETEFLPPDELRAWRDSLIPIAEEALGDEAHFNPGAKQCRWCPAAGQCRAQMQWATDLDFGTDVDVLTNDEIGSAMEQVPTILDWCNAVRVVAMEKIYSRGEHVPGQKVVRSTGRRGIPDSEGAIEALMMVGHALDEISTRKIKGIGELEKLLGKEEFNRVLVPYVKKGEGSLSLVPEDDPRPSADPNEDAKKEFQ